MPYPYDNYQISPEQRKGLLIGSMLAGGLGYGAGRAGNDNLSSIVQGLGSGVIGVWRRCHGITGISIKGLRRCIETETN